MAPPDEVITGERPHSEESGYVEGLMGVHVDVQRVVLVHPSQLGRRLQELKVGRRSN